MLTAALAAALLAGAPSAAVAESGRAGAAAGHLTFEAIQAGARFTGRFREFAANISFDPADPAACRFDVTINAGSADTEESRRDETLKGEDFFWAARYPSARYRGASCRKAGKGFELDGELTLRGVTRPVTLQFTFEPGPAAGRLAGKATLQRLDFGVGQGEWSSTEWVGGEVVVRFDLVLPR
jgi:polyisoprenoid-binding protein YceI